MAPHEYLPLPEDGRAIRLLQLFSGNFSDNIRLSITHQRFPKEDSVFPTNEALSYVWGSQDDPVSVYVHSYVQERAIEKSLALISKIKDALRTLSKESRSQLPVTLELGPNLASALRHLRLKKRLRTLWIDAICISQQDLEERGKEVLKMGEINRQASRVVVWLGPSSEDSSLALDTLASLGKHIKVDYDNIK